MSIGINIINEQQKAAAAQIEFLLIIGAVYLYENKMNSPATMSRTVMLSGVRACLVMVPVLLWFGLGLVTAVLTLRRRAGARFLGPIDGWSRCRTS